MRRFTRLAALIVTTGSMLGIGGSLAAGQPASAQPPPVPHFDHGEEFCIGQNFDGEICIPFIWGDFQIYISRG